MLGIKFTAIVDPNTELAMSRMSEYSQGPNAAKWKDVEIFSDHKAMLGSEASLSGSICQRADHFFKLQPVSCCRTHDCILARPAIVCMHVPGDGLFKRLLQMLRTSVLVEQTRRSLHRSSP